MDETRGEITLKVEGLQGAGCAEAVRRAIQTLDPQAQVDVDLGRGQVSARTHADTLEVTAALTKAGYNATAMTG